MLGEASYSPCKIETAIAGEGTYIPGWFCVFVTLGAGANVVGVVAADGPGSRFTGEKSGSSYCDPINRSAI
jgi:hypothetical protein